MLWIALKICVNYTVSINPASEIKNPVPMYLILDSLISDRLTKSLLDLSLNNGTCAFIIFRLGDYCMFLFANYTIWLMKSTLNYSSDFNS